MPPPGFAHQDKLIHALEYAMLAALLVRALVLGPPRLVAGTAVWVAVVAAVLFGISDELHQIVTPGRDASVADVIADSCGGLGGGALAGLFYPPWLRRSRSRSSDQE
jgi:VanZ family protein